MNQHLLTIYGLLITVSLTGCGGVTFPAQSLDEAAKSAGAMAAYATKEGGKADFFMFADSAGRIDRVGYDRTGGGKPTEFVELDSIPMSQCRHLVLILDGFGYDVVSAFYDLGHLRICHHPSRVIAPYPTLTDLAIEDALGLPPCRGMEAEYFNRKTMRVEGGSAAYMNEENEPYDRKLQYRASKIWDAIGYLYPEGVFGKEINDSMRLFDKDQTREVIAYYVSSAAVGTRYGAAGQVRCLEKVERLVNQAVWETGGKVKVTIFADHGHSYTPATRIPLEGYLAAKGWRVEDSLKKSRDVAYIRFGLETYAAFSTFTAEEAAPLAADLIAADGVELASYADSETVTVLGRGGARGRVSQKNGRFRYDAISGDPLKLKEALAKLKPDGEGFHDEDQLLAATYDAYYPDALQRLWRAHHGIVQNTPDVIISLEDRFYSGSSGFAGAVNIASTHGGLNRSNSTAFIMSSAGPLPPFMRSADIPRNMEKLTGQKFPLGK
ncbi:MAG: hypothetical protein ACE15C_04190 [Phycisphaerae bacterium]